jgi:hypothetical protein
MSGDITTIGEITAGVAKDDGQVAIPFMNGIATDSAVYTVTRETNVMVNSRTAAQQTDYYTIPIITPSRTTALKGIKLKSVEVSYRMTSANTTDDDLEFHILKQSLPANGAAATAAILAGDSDSDYDTDHNTKAERLLSTGAPQLHTCTVTIPSGEQAYLADGEQLFLRVKCKDNDTANLVLALTGAVANFDVSML